MSGRGTAPHPRQMYFPPAPSTPPQQSMRQQQDEQYLRRYQESMRYHQLHSRAYFAAALQQQSMTCRDCGISFATPLDSYRHTMECHPHPSMIHPARLGPPPTESPAERVAYLELLLRYETMEATRTNIRAILSLYRQGRIEPNRIVYAQGGVIFDTMPAPRPGTQIWTERPGVILEQYMQRG